MKYVLDDLDVVKKELKDKQVFLFLDYDGTLAPIAERPSQARLPQATRVLLQRLVDKGRCKIAVVSGRSLDDVKKMIGMKDIIYVGNHGLEIEGPKLKFKSPLSPGFAKLLGRVNKELSRRLLPVKGVLVEHKGPTLSVHYRMVKNNDEAVVKNIFYSVMEPYMLKGDVHVTFGKKVFEVRPPLRWDKGEAVLWLLARQKFAKKAAILPIYIGDDVTDEDAFKALKGNGLTVMVGKPLISNAKHYLEDWKDVAKFLESLTALCGS